MNETRPPEHSELAGAQFVQVHWPEAVSNEGNTTVSEASKSDVANVFGRLDDETVAQIISTGATVAELKIARDWVTRGADSTIGNPSMGPGAIGKVIEIMESLGDPLAGPS